jgi:hypothetical protein
MKQHWRILFRSFAKLGCTRKDTDQGLLMRTQKTDEALFFMTRIVNHIGFKSEISVMMAAAVLLGLKSSVSSHQFEYVCIQPAIAFVEKCLIQNAIVVSDTNLDLHALPYRKPDH